MFFLFSIFFLHIDLQLTFNHFDLPSVSNLYYSRLFQGRVLGPILLAPPSLLSPLGNPKFVCQLFANIYLQAKSVLCNTHLVALAYLKINFVVTEILAFSLKPGAFIIVSPKSVDYIIIFISNLSPHPSHI